MDSTNGVAKHPLKKELTNGLISCREAPFLDYKEACQAGSPYVSTVLPPHTPALYRNPVFRHKVQAYAEEEL